MLNSSVTIRAENIEKAILEGLQQLNIPKEQAIINIIAKEKKGFLGFGKQDAIVEVSIKQDLNIDNFSDAIIHNKKPVIDEDDAQSEKTAKTVDNEKAEKDSTDSISLLKEDKASAKPQQIITLKEKPEIEEKIQTKEEAIQTVGNYIQNILSEYGAKVKVTAFDDGKQISYEIKTSKPGLVIGKHGRTINSLQILAQILLHRLARKNLLVVLNVGDYRNRRAHVLQQIAEQESKNVLSTRKPSVLDPLPAYERKQIHAHLSKMTHIRTRSEGKEPNRYLIIEYRP